MKLQTLEIVCTSTEAVAKIFLFFHFLLKEL